MSLNPILLTLYASTTDILTPPNQGMCIDVLVAMRSDPEDIPYTSSEYTPQTEDVRSCHALF